MMRNVLIVAVVLVQLGCAAAMWQLLGPCGVALWAWIAWMPVIERAVLGSRLVR